MFPSIVPPTTLIIVVPELFAEFPTVALCAPPYTLPVISAPASMFIVVFVVVPPCDPPPYTFTKLPDLMSMFALSTVPDTFAPPKMFPLSITASPFNTIFAVPTEAPFIPPP